MVATRLDGAAIRRARRSGEPPDRRDTVSALRRYASGEMPTIGSPWPVKDPLDAVEFAVELFDWLFEPPFCEPSVRTCTGALTFTGTICTEVAFECASCAVNALGPESREPRSFPSCTVTERFF